MWENMYKKLYSMICDGFLANLYFVIFRQEFPRISKKTKKLISLIGNLYLEEKCTYFRIFGAIGSPHLLPYYVPNQLDLGKYIQTILQGFNASFIKDKKRDVIPYGFQLGYYFIKDTTQEKEEGLSHLEYRFMIGGYHKNDPKELVSKHVGKVVIY
jgi:hypothetical protein